MFALLYLSPTRNEFDKNRFSLTLLLNKFTPQKHLKWLRSSPMIALKYNYKEYPWEKKIYVQIIKATSALRLKAECCLTQQWIH